ncbi:hypothetical protein ABZP36_011724 [Zizania latifolia]
MWQVPRPGARSVCHHTPWTGSIAPAVDRATLGRVADLRRGRRRIVGARAGLRRAVQLPAPPLSSPPRPSPSGEVLPQGSAAR